MNTRLTLILRIRGNFAPAPPYDPPQLCVFVLAAPTGMAQTVGAASAANAKTGNHSQDVAWVLDTAVDVIRIFSTTR
jgi:hypothetical protein